MPIIVQKYGGSSAADVDKIKKIASQIAAVKKEGNDVVAVVSAMGKTTNQLLEMAKSLSSDPEKRELDMLLSTGERITMALLCIALNDLGIKAISLTGSQSGVITNDRYNDARVIEVRPFRVQDELAKGQVVVIGGFQGVSYKRDITTLGRGGSDTSAVAMAAALNAERCEIYSDVDGIYTADPNLIKEAKHLPEMSFQQLQEMSEAGAKVLNAQAVQFAKESKIAIYARSTFSPGRETITRESQPSEITSVIAVVHETEVIRIIYSGSDIKQLLEFLEGKNIYVKEFNYVQGDRENTPRASFVISRKNIHSWNRTEKELDEIFKDRISIDDSSGAVSLIGEGFSRDNKIIKETFAVLLQNGIEPKGLTTTSFRLSVLIAKENVESAVAILHKYWIEEAR
ncbi:MAG TPA: aspartate kinase [Ignavibacteriaceae bacterium]|jgi:aspartate kinase|nr:aspartate kinase [Ignavibacteriaceae bacterium]